MVIRQVYVAKDTDKEILKEYDVNMDFHIIPICPTKSQMLYKTRLSMCIHNISLCMSHYSEKLHYWAK